MHSEAHDAPDSSSTSGPRSPETVQARGIDPSSAGDGPRLSKYSVSRGVGAGPASPVLILPNPRDIVASLRQFSEISLEETNQSAQMLKRIDNKYAVDKSLLLKILDDLRDDFRILRIDSRSIFSYKSCYFDDEGQCFLEHLQGRRQRFKVRTRLYVESDRSYFEVKLKGKRGQTDKSRMKCEQFEAYAVSDEELKMLGDLYEKSYGKAFRYSMRPALHVTYKRFTLVAASGGERVTVDFSIGFETPSGKRAQIGNDFIIVETKSADGRGKSDQVLKRHHVRQAVGCSKYCIGMILAGEVETYNKFRPIVRTIRSRMQRPNGDEEQQQEHAPGDGTVELFAQARPVPCAK